MMQSDLLRRRAMQPLTVNVGNRALPRDLPRNQDLLLPMVVGAMAGNVLFNFISNRAGGINEDARQGAVAMGALAATLLSDKVRTIWRATCDLLREI